MSLEKITKLMEKELSKLGKAEKKKVMGLLRKLSELAEKTEDALTSLDLKEKGEKRIEEIREKLKDAPLAKKALQEVEKELEDMEEL